MTELPKKEPAGTEGSTTVQATSTLRKPRAGSRRYRWGLVAAVSSLLLLTPVVASILLPAEAAGFPDPAYKCSIDSALDFRIGGPPSSTHPQLLLNVKIVLTNAEDIGITGRYWALDYFLEKGHAWLIRTSSGAFSAGQIYVIIQLTGRFVSAVGALSPEHQVPEAYAPFGTMKSLTAEILTNYSFTPGALPTGTHSTSRDLGTHDDGGTTADLLAGTQSGATTPFYLILSYFTPGAGFQSSYLDWGWSYHMDKTFTPLGGSVDNASLCQTSLGDAGDIAT